MFNPPLGGKMNSFTRKYQKGTSLGLALSTLLICCQAPGFAQGLVFKTFLEAGDNCASQGRYGEAEKNYKACLSELGSGDSESVSLTASGLKLRRDMLLKLAHVLAAQGKYGPAVAHLQKAQALLGKDATVFELAEGISEIGQMQRYEGKSKDSLASFTTARDMLKAALAKVKGADRSAYTDALSNSLMGVSVACQELGQNEAAEEALKQNIALYDQGADTSALCKAMEALAKLRVRQDRLTEAESLLTKSLDMRVAKGGESFDLVETLLPLAKLYFLQEKMDDGEAQLKRALAICNGLDAAKGTSRSALMVLCNVLDTMSEHYMEMGAYKKALSTASRQVELRQTLYGGDHPKVADAVGRLAEIQYNAREYDKSLANYKKAIDIAEKAYGKEAPEVARYLNELGLVYLSLGKYDESKSVYERALTIVESARGKEHLDVATCLNNLALLKLNMGLLAEAQTLTERGLAIRKQALGGESPVVARNLVNLANILIAQKKYDDAESKLLEALKIQEAVYIQPAHSEKIETMLELGKVYLDSGKYEESQKYLEAVLKGDESIYGNASPPVASDLELLVKLFNAQRKPTEATPYAQRLRKVKLALLPGAGSQGVGDNEQEASVSGTASGTTNNGDGSTGSLTVASTIEQKNNVRAHGPTSAIKRPVRDKWALVIGISSFKDSSINLKYAAKDATDFKNYLISDAGFKSDHVRLLTNEQATRENIVADLGDKWLARRAHPDDLVVVYISSHGSAAKKEVANANFILPYEGNIHNVVLTGIPMQWFTVGVKELVKADRTLLVLDVCHGGAAAEEGAISGGKAIKRKAIEGIDMGALDVGEGQLVLASSLANQLSWESINYPNSVFTRRLIEGLKLKGKHTGINEAFNYMKNQVEDEVLRDRGELQAPVLRNSGWSGGDLSIACPVMADTFNYSEQASEDSPAVSTPKQTLSSKGIGNKTQSSTSTTSSAVKKYNAKRSK